MHRAGHASPVAALRYQHVTKDSDQVLAKALAELSNKAPVVPIAAGRPSEAIASADKSRTTAVAQ
jgi:hypothetical protein